ncbi:MAG: hypothetical protein M0D57_10555 [Sphingobacteriales bacterium JAD_PAG50586_3]|nr:MAG: hypothetical protein M0D57_10555 [Sphingobacteriales bacterium JAD_PAG50586_3]
MLYEQSARSMLSLLIGQIVKNDPKHNNGKYYSLTTALLQTKKPYIIWEVYKAIKYYKPEITPYLLTDKEISVYSFHVLSNLSFHETNISPLIQKGAFKLIIDSLVDQNIAKDIFSNIIFQCIRSTTSEKFKIKGFAQEIIDNNHTRDIESSNLLRNEFEIYKLPHTIFTEYGKQKQNLFIDYLVSIYELIKSFDSITGYSNGILEFPYVKIDLFNWILELRLSQKYKNQSNDLDNLPARICDAVLEIYQNFIGKELVEVDDLWEIKKVIKIPHLFVKKELLLIIDWGSIILELHFQKS